MFIHFSSDRTTTIPSHITVQTLPRTDDKYNTTFQEANIPCSFYNNTKLWFKEMPTGYFYNDRWILLHCKGKISFVKKIHTM
jgi:hypothetical protein